MHQNEVSSRQHTDRPSLLVVNVTATIRSIPRKVCNVRTNGSRAKAGTNSSVFQTLDPAPWTYKLL